MNIYIGTLAEHLGMLDSDFCWVFTEKDFSFNMRILNSNFP